MQKLDTDKAQQSVQKLALNDSQTTQKLPTFSQEERDAVAYFFLRITSVYGQSMVDKQWPTAELLKMTKREYAKELGALSREDINTIITAVKAKRKAKDPDYTWPNIDACLGVLDEDQEHWQHKRLQAADDKRKQLLLEKTQPTEEDIERNKQLGKSAFSKMMEGL